MPLDPGDGRGRRRFAWCGPRVTAAQEIDQPPRMRWGLFLTSIAVCGLLAVVLIIVTVVMTGFAVLDASGGPDLSRAARAEIAGANCQQLSSLEAWYTPNGDSVEPDITALRLTTERQAELDCDET